MTGGSTDQSSNNTENISRETIRSLLGTVGLAAGAYIVKKAAGAIGTAVCAHPYIACAVAAISVSAGVYYIFKLKTEIADLRNDIGRLTIDNDQLVIVNRDLREVVTALLDNNNDLKEIVAVLLDNNDDLKNQLAALKVEIRCLRNDNGHLREELAAIREENADLKRENGEVKEELAAIRRENADLKEKMGEMHTSIDEMKKMMASMMMGRQETQNQNRDNAGNR